MLNRFAEEGEHHGVVLKQMKLKMPGSAKFEKPIAYRRRETANAGTRVKHPKCCGLLGREQARHERAHLRRREELALFLAIIE
jgi:hypothetical protein